MKLLEVEDLSVSIHGTEILDSVSFNVNKSEIFGIVGESGSGKSMTALSLMGLLPNGAKSTGSASLSDTNLLTLSEEKMCTYRGNAIGMIFQDFKLMNDRTIFENISLPLQIIGINKDIIISKVKNVLTKVGLSQRANSFPGELSGGEQQKACVARALIKNPKLIIADEPTGNLDPSSSDDIIDLLENESNKGTTIVMATHKTH